MQLIQMIRLTYLVKENKPTKGSCSIRKAAKKATTITIEKDAKENGSINDGRRKMYS